MRKLIHIAEGWYNMATDRYKELAMQRLEICDTCPFKAQLSPAGQVLVQAVNSESSVFYCSSCGCPLETKVRVPGEQCPQRNWLAHEPEESFY